MNLNPISSILIIAFFYPLIKGFLLKFSSNDLKISIEDLNKNISFIIAFLLGIYYSKRIFIQHDKLYKQIYKYIPRDVMQYIDNNNFIIYLVIVPLFIFILYKIILMILKFINYFTIYPLLDNIEKFLRMKSDVFKRIMGVIFQIPRSICYVILVTFLFNLISMFNIEGRLNKYLETSKSYKYVCKEIVIPLTNSRLAKRLPNIIDNSFKVVIKEGNIGIEDVTKQPKNKTIIYYNGITLDEGVKSNEAINSFGRNIVNNENNTKGKAKILYNWIGNNISYDNDKANKVLKNNFNVKSGAIPTFQSRKGICFDYACLYVAMCRANNIKVRLITGDGFNGLNWVSHSWNQVYIPEENIWINVDTTFYRGGNYFNSRRFKIDHKNSNIAGEW